MRKRAPIYASVVLAATGFGAGSAAGQEEYRHGHIRHVENGVTLQRATEAMAEEAIPNLPFLPGDRVWTDATGRAAFQFPEGTVVRLDRESKLDYTDHDESRDERVVLRLWSGRLILRARLPESAAFEIETPGGLVEALGPTVVRIDVEGGETVLSVYDGEASLDTGPDRVQLSAGEQTWARWGDAPAEPVPFDRYAQDDFGLWDGDLESREAWAANSRRYLPRELEPYATEFDTYGSWAYEEPVGYVWQPRVAAGWAPYSNGRWIWTTYGWTWVPYEPWGWAPHHYGRWGFSVSLGWYWAPGTVWGGGWVSWGVGSGYVGWCALGRYNRPVIPWSHHRGRAVPRRGHPGPGPHDRAVPRGAIPHERAWSVVRREDLGRGAARRRVDPRSVGALQVADSIDQRPDRSARALTRTAAVPEAARARPRPGAAARAARGASPVPLGSATIGTSSARSRGALSRRAPGGGGDPVSAAVAAARAGRARPRAGTATGRTALPPRERSEPAWVGSSRSNRNRSVVRPSPSRSRDRGVTGSLFGSGERSGSEARARSRTEVTSRPAERGSSSGVSSRPRSRPSPMSSAPSRARSGGSPNRGVSSRPSTGGSRNGGISSRPPSSGSRSSGVSSRPRSSGSRSSGASSRPRSSGSRSSGASSRPRSSGSRSSGASSRPRGGGSGSSGASSRSRGGGGSRSRSGSGNRSSARSRGGSRRN